MTSSAPVFTPATGTPSTDGNGGDPVTPPVTGGNGNGAGGPGTGSGGMTGGNGNGGSMTPTPATSAILTGFPTPSTGGAARVVGTQVDSKDAVLLIISDTDINALLQTPLTAELLDNTGVDLTYADSPSSDTTTAAAVISARADNTMPSGKLYSLAVIGGSSFNTSIYIDDHAPVVLGYEAEGSSLELTMIGEPLPTSVTDFSGTYSGFVAATRTRFTEIAAATSPFKMVVGFANGESTISSFNANFGTHGSMMAANIPINANATFTSADGGTVTFTAGTNTVLSVFNNTANAGSGSFYGQFHGSAGNGVTGAFHNSANTVLGGFAGSKE